MLAYDSRNWVRLSLSYSGTVLPRVLLRVGVLTALALGVFVTREVYLTLASPPDAPAPADPLRPFRPLGHLLIGVALGLLIVFRSNCSYDRYWEGRKLWGGIVNASRNLMRGAAVVGGDVKTLAGLVAAYALAVKQRLRRATDLTEIRPHVSPEVYAQASAAVNPPAVIALHMSRWVQARTAAGTPAVAAEGLEQQVRALTDCQGGCERILLTPVPFAYAVHNKQLLMLYLLSLPFVLVEEMGWAAVPATAVIAFGLLGIEEAGGEIENPFGTDPNDLDIDGLCAGIARDAKAMAEVAA
jgi:putative membrane protein